MKYRKKPVVIEAVQWRDTNWAEIQAFVGMDALGRGIVGPDQTGLSIQTLEGRMHVSVDDWIIRGVKGELYPCKPDIFVATYEPVDA